MQGNLSLNGCQRHISQTVYSDDRSAAALKERVLNATEMQQVLGTAPRPNCVIVDEIDGANKAAINTLVKIIQAGSSSSYLLPCTIVDLISLWLLDSCQDKRQETAGASEASYHLYL